MDYSTVPQEVLDYFKGYDASPFSSWWNPTKNGRYTDSSGYQWIPYWEGGSAGGGVDANSDPGRLVGYRRGETANEANDPFRAEATNLYYSPDGKFSYVNKDDKGWLNPITGILAVATFGLGSAYLSAAGEAAGAVGAGEAAGAGSGAFLGEGAASGVGAWDSALASAGAGGAGSTAAMGAGAGEVGSGAGFVGEGAASGVPAWDAAGSGVAAGAGSTSPNWLQSLGNTMGGGGTGWSSLIGPAMSLIGGAYSANKAGNAADTQAQAAREAAALAEPWRQKGIGALNQMSLRLGIDGDPNDPNYNSLNKKFTFTNQDPSYQWRLDQGLRSVKNAYASKGNFLSGGAMKGINDYAQGAASTEYGNEFNRDQATKTNIFNRFASLAGTGQTASNTMGEYKTQAGNAQAAGQVGSANAWANALGGAYNTWQQNEIMNQLLRR